MKIWILNRNEDCGLDKVKAEGFFSKNTSEGVYANRDR